jgi:2-dehydro-3-deoxygluconokinase
MVELRAVGPDIFARSHAGDAYNTAVYLKRSLPEAQVQFLTAAGDDEMSKAMRLAWATQGIDDSLAFTVEHGTAGIYLIENDESGERSFHYWRKDSAAKHWLERLTERQETVLWGADLIYYSGITLAILNPEHRAAALEVIARARPHVKYIAFDPNVRLRLWQSPQVAAQTILAAMSSCDIALPSTEDLTWLLGTANSERQLELLRDMGVAEAALTLGPDGCAILAEELRSRLPAPCAELTIDTSGAGDSFNGAYLANRLKGRSPTAAAQAALCVASRVVTHAGAVVPISVSHPATS